MPAKPRLSLLLLLFALLYGQWLLASHDHPLSGKAAGGDECQFCLHVPLAKGAAPGLVAPVPPAWAAPLVPGRASIPRLSAAAHRPQARAPPVLFPHA